MSVSGDYGGWGRGDERTASGPLLNETQSALYPQNESINTHTKTREAAEREGKSEKRDGRKRSSATPQQREQLWKGNGTAVERRRRRRKQRIHHSKPYSPNISKSSPTRVRNNWKKKQIATLRNCSFQKTQIAMYIAHYIDFKLPNC